jgi:uncharacterized protein YodC (DUF2158 family)
MDFEPGQLVMLKSGGPPVTIVSIDGDSVRCMWFAHADDRLQEATIPAICLENLGDEDAEGDFNERDRGDEPPPRARR